MKKLIILCVVSLFLSEINGQVLGKFRTDLTGGYAIPAAGGGGFSYSIEPKYGLTDNINLGVRLAGAFLAKDLDLSGESYESEVAGMTTYMGTANYYFNDGSMGFAPFMGLGLGMATVAAMEIKQGDFRADVSPETKFGFMFRGGIEFKKAIISFEYNFVPKTEYDKVQTSSGEMQLDENLTSKNSYFGINVGFFLGGGKWGG